ncbi:MAG: hypothetical protein HYS77_15525, partial [Candidatus Rokubacteria bacterium]|nr:hypothetical protein [Candidatus Rokubacteria bacterium]
RATVAVIRLTTDVPALGAVDFNLTLIAAFQAAGLVFILALVILFARWLLQPYRRLLSAAGQAPGQVAGLAGAAGRDETDDLVQAFQGVLDKLREQEGELQRLKGAGARASPQALASEQLVGGMSSAVLVFDRDGRLAVLNPAAERLLGLDRGSSVGRKYGDLLGRSERLIDLIARSLLTGESAGSGAMVSPVRPGSELSPPGRPPEGVFCLLADLTEIKALREKVGLKENLAALGEMSAGIAHEFRNALATIHGLARLILKSNGHSNGHMGPSSPREHAETILREVEGIERVVTDFLRYARPVTLNLSEVDLQDLVDNLAREAREEAAPAGVAVEVRGAFPRIVADEALVRQAIRNLLMNAIEAFPPSAAAASDRGPGAAARRVVVHGEPQSDPQGGVRLVVEDNGPGIAREVLPRIFTPFFTTKVRGTGLGLALVQKTAVVHDGQVEVKSDPGRGTTFALILPACPGAPAAAPPL